VSGSKSKTHPLRHGYERLLLSCWLIAMLSLAFPWWKSISAVGSIAFGNPFLVAVGITGGSAFVTVVPNHGSSGIIWANYQPFDTREHFDSLEEEGLYDYFGRFKFVAERRTGIGRMLVVFLPIWFLMFVVSLLFWALHLFLKRRIRLILGKLPDPSHFDRAEQRANDS
jgi:hypothetical protein